MQTFSCYAQRTLIAAFVFAVTAWLGLSAAQADQQKQQPENVTDKKVDDAAAAPSKDTKATGTSDEKQKAAADRKKAEREKLEKLMEEARRAYEEEQKELERRLKSDPKWQPTHKQVAIIRLGDPSKLVALNNYCLNRDGNLLAACGGQRIEYVAGSKPDQYTAKVVSDPAEIRVLDPDGKLLKTWSMEFKPEAICAAPDGTVFVGGAGRLAKFDPEGKLLAAVDSPAIAAEKSEQQAKDKAGEKDGKKSAKKSSSMMAAILQAFGVADKKEEDAAQAKALAERSKTVTGIAVTNEDLFVACPMRTGWGYSVWRLDINLGQPKQIVEKLSGCCGQMDIQAKDGELWVAHNARHCVERYDRDGKKLSAFGKRDRKKAEGFGGCCEPKNLRFGPQGDVYTAESGPPVAVKRFSAEGKFLNVVGVPEYQSGCVRVTVEVARGGDRIYVLSPSENAIYVLDRKPKADSEKKDAVTPQKDAKTSDKKLG